MKKPTSNEIEILVGGIVSLLESKEFFEFLADLNIATGIGHYEQYVIERAMGMLRDHIKIEFDRDDKALVLKNAIFALNSALTVVLRPKEEK